MILAASLLPASLAVVGLLVLLALLDRLTEPTHAERLMRERRRHAEETARAMQRISAIRQQTIERMRQAELEVRR
ncbi:MAG TPA: hypothetical protein VES65_10475 [Solirubrobacteraceae bacterium]|nr:hypothetical protein [Solirubrobacteraceae bacterium]